MLRLPVVKTQERILLHHKAPKGSGMKRPRYPGNNVSVLSGGHRGLKTDDSKKRLDPQCLLPFHETSSPLQKAHGVSSGEYNRIKQKVSGLEDTGANEHRGMKALQTGRLMKLKIANC